MMAAEFAFYLSAAVALALLFMLLTEVRTAVVLSICLAILGAAISLLMALLGAFFPALAALLFTLAASLTFLLLGGSSWGWGPLELALPSPSRVGLKLVGALAVLVVIGLLTSLLLEAPGGPLPIVDLSASGGEELGLLLFGEASQALQLLACLILVALVGSILLSEGEEG
jgi:NADH:ubiquinone oxidoreductase subunit 6 (subunit J)